MSDGTAREVETLLQRALAPVDPPEGLADRLESRLTSLSAMAAEELENWELKAMRDPRNWVRPAAAVAVGAAAGAGLIVLRMGHHRHNRGRSAKVAALAERTLEDLRRLGPKR